MRWRKTAFSLVVVGAAVWAGSASATAQPEAYSFHDCVGPAGTPTSFTAVKQYSSPSSKYGVSAALSFRLTNGTGVFVVKAFNGVPIGKGIPASDMTTTCLVDFAAPEGTLPVSGFITGP
jgi:hypothetical protein